MANSSEIHVVLNPAVAEVVHQAVASGEYASDSEVIREAVLEWRLRRVLNEADRSAIRQLWDEGVESSPGQFGSMAELKREARRRQAEQRSPRKR